MLRPETSLAVEMQAWIGATRIRDLIVPEAERLPLTVACEVASLMSALGVRVWLVEYEPARHRLDPLLNSASVTTMTLANFEAQWLGDAASASAGKPATALAQRREAFPAVPQSHGVVFRAECRRLLREADFAVVDGLYREVFGLTEKALADDCRRQHPQRLATLFRGLFRRIPNPDAVVTAARAMQASALLEGWNVIADELRLRSAALLDPREATRPAAEWSKLNSYGRTDLPALCALLASDVTPTQVGRLTVGGVDTEACRAVLFDDPVDEHLPLLESALFYVRAHVLRLQLGGARDGDLLFPGLGTSVKSATERCNTYTRKAASEVGFRVVRRLEGRIETENVVKQVSRLGVTFKSFDRQCSSASEVAE